VDLGDELDLAGLGGGGGRKDEQEEDGRSIERRSKVRSPLRRWDQSLPPDGWVAGNPVPFRASPAPVRLSSRTEKHLRSRGGMSPPRVEPGEPLMKKSLFATCLLLLALSNVMSPAATVDSTSVGLPDQLNAAGCCQRTCPATIRLYLSKVFPRLCLPGVGRLHSFPAYRRRQG
jgi:hypothetical protein